MNNNIIKIKKSEESFLLMIYLDKKSYLNNMKNYLKKDFLYNIEKLDQDLLIDKKKDDKYLYLELIRLININNFNDKKNFIIKLKKEPLYLRKIIFNTCKKLLNNKEIHFNEHILIRNFNR